MPRLAYLCLQQTLEGQASHAHVHEIIAGLRRRGWDVDLHEVTRDAPGQRAGKLRYLGRYLQPQVHLIPRLSRYDLVYIRSDALAWPTALGARLGGIPVVHEVNGPYQDRFIAKPWTRRFRPVFIGLQRAQLRRASALITVTPAMADWLAREAPGRPVHVVPNGANTAIFRPGAAPWRPGFPYVLFFGVLAPWQGVETLLEAVRHPDWPAGVRAVIAGDGQLRPRVAQAAREHAVEYRGVVPYQDMPGLIAGSIAGLSLKRDLPERPGTGMSPLKLYETLACGVPAIVTDYHGQTDILRACEGGVVIPQNDDAALARAVRRLAGDEALRQAMGARAAGIIRREHSWDQRADSVHRILLGLLDGTARAAPANRPDNPIGGDIPL